MGGLPVSAPGALSSRTDLARQPVRDIPGGEWGEGKEMREIQAAAPMAALVAPPPPTGLFAPTARPGEPVTSGVNYGPGVGADAIAQQPSNAAGAQGTLSEKVRRMVAVDPSGDSARLLAITERLGW
jgi:hypothetical protein